MTLVEVIVALALFSFFVAGLCMLIVRTKQMNDMTRSHYLAAHIAKSHIEKARALPFDQITFATVTGAIVNAAGAGDPNGDYRLTASVTAVDSNLVEIVASVQIRDRATMRFGEMREEISSYVAAMMELPED